MHFDPEMITIISMILVILSVGFVLRVLQQPHVVAYLIAGVILGPYILDVISDQATLDRIGQIGVIMLLFFVGMEVSPKRLLANWKVAVLGTSLQITVSVLVMYAIGELLDWSISRSIFYGFVISMSSTAVLMSFLQERGLLKHQLGEDVLSVSLMQDILVIPMLILLTFLSGSNQSGENVVDSWILIQQAIGGCILIGLFIWLLVAKSIHLPFGTRLRSDHELQVFLALGLCFGVAVVTGLLHLSAALGAFVAGMVVGAAKETTWVHSRLDALRVILVALFFVSIGMLLDLQFIYENIFRIIGLVIAVFAMNTLINAIVFRAVGRTWKHSFFVAAMLAQIGEFAFVLAAVGLQLGIIEGGTAKTAIAVIALSLLLSPLWIKLFSYGLHDRSSGRFSVKRFLRRRRALTSTLDDKNGIEVSEVEVIDVEPVHESTQR